MCRAPDCPTNARPGAAGLCSRHGGVPVCGHAGCTTPSRARGLCGKHGAHGVCRAPGCLTNALRCGWTLPEAWRWDCVRASRVHHPLRSTRALRQARWGSPGSVHLSRRLHLPRRQARPMPEALCVWGLPYTRLQEQRYQHDWTLPQARCVWGLRCSRLHYRRPCRLQRLLHQAQKVACLGCKHTLWKEVFNGWSYA